ncbi:hypothetical protein LWI28_002156 [Acer negundo]|uniref:Uncharacterized protein n=1 Tax=Acer negundo TaxID=4023 RepID=A0AAD5I5C0_ACENE|nr:hypothetical protein LWI28_002156 [Acer negundo]
MNSKLPHTDQFRFLDKAAIITADDRLDSDAIIFHVASIQQQTYAVFQALQSDRSIGSSNFQAKKVE